MSPPAKLGKRINYASTSSDIMIHSGTKLTNLWFQGVVTFLSLGGLMLGQRQTQSQLCARYIAKVLEKKRSSYQEGIEPHIALAIC